MTTPKKIEKLYIITKDEKGHLHHYSSKRASMHSDIILEFDIDLDKHIILEKGFIQDNHFISANFDIRGDKIRQEHNKRHNDGK